MAFDPVAKVLCYTGYIYPIFGGLSLNREIRSHIQFVRM